ncbi:hypothetical protein C8J57DRAFT_1530895 [Mycena rebaudengoi]|nr:hypothetical protein C8J57DRAFT_1530895 [Mycena rebaudengoi]
MMPWVLLGPKGRSGNHSWVEDPKSLTKFTFILATLRASPFSSTPNHLGEGPLIFIAPRLRNLYGPIDSLSTLMKRLPDYVLSHRCFGQHVLQPILVSLRNVPDPVDDDEDFTSSDFDVHFPEAEVLVDQMVVDGLPPLSNNAPIQAPQEMVQKPNMARTRRIEAMVGLEVKKEDLPLLSKPDKEPQQYNDWKIDQLAAGIVKTDIATGKALSLSNGVSGLRSLQLLH